MNQVRRRHDVAQEAEARHDRAERPPLRHDVDELDLEQVARTRALDEHGSGQRMNGAERQRFEVGHRRARRQKPIDRVPRLEGDFFALVDLDDRRDIGMPAVVPRLRLIGQVPLAVDPDAFHVFSLSDQCRMPGVLIGLPTSNVVKYSSSSAYSTESAASMFAPSGVMHHCMRLRMSHTSFWLVRQVGK